MEDLSETGCLHTFVTDFVCFLNNSGEEKINSFIVAVSSLNFLIEEQISSMNVFKGTENVAIVEEFEVPPQILFHILRPFTKLTNFQRHLERKRYSWTRFFSSRIVCKLTNLKSLIEQEINLKKT